MREYKLADIQQSFPKTKIDMWWARLWVRRVSFLVAWMFLRLKWRPNQVSYLALVVGVLACVLLANPLQSFRIVGAVLLNIWFILDCADGNMARVLGTDSPHGEFIDAMVGYITMAGAFLASGIGVLLSTGSNPPVFSRVSYALFGAVAAIATVLSRLIYQKHLSSSLVADKEGESHGAGNPLKRLDLEIGFSGLFMPLVVLATIFDLLFVVPLFYFLYSSLGLIALVMWYIFKVEAYGGSRS